MDKGNRIGLNLCMLISTFLDSRCRLMTPPFEMVEIKLFYVKLQANFEKIILPEIMDPTSVSLPMGHATD